LNDKKCNNFNGKGGQHKTPQPENIFGALSSSIVGRRWEKNYRRSRVQF